MENVQPLVEPRALTEHGIRCSWDNITSYNCSATCSANANYIFRKYETPTIPVMDLVRRTARVMMSNNGSPCKLAADEEHRIIWVISLEAPVPFSFYVQYERYYLTHSLKGYSSVTTKIPIMIFSGGAVNHAEYFFKEVRIYVYGIWWYSWVQHEETIYIEDGQRVGMRRAPDEFHGAVARAVLRNTYLEVHIYPDILPNVLTRIGGATAFLAAIALLLRMYNQQQLSELHQDTVELERLVKVIKVVENKLIHGTEKESLLDGHKANECNLIDMTQSDSETEPLPFIPGLMCQRTSESFYHSQA